MSRRAKRPIRFKNVRRTVCPACLDRHALNIVGRPLFIHGSKLAGGCEVCGGSGEVTEGFSTEDYYQDAWAIRTVPVKVLVCGSRTWDDKAAVYRQLEGLSPKTLILHGGAKGADSLADQCARELGFRRPKKFLPDWDTYGKKAGILRNLRMLDEKPDLVLAFQKDGSRGTQHTIDEAKRRGIPVEVFTA